MNIFFSDDDGRVWDAGGAIVDAEGRRNYDPAGTTPHNLCRLHSGAIGLVYWQQSAADADDGSLNGVNQGMFCKSSDEAQTWSAPVPISPARTPSYPTFLIQLQSGRLIVPNEYAFQQASAGDVRSEMSLFSCLYSDDEGSEWRESPDSMFVREDEGATLHFVETPTVAETADGRLLCFMRCEMQRLAQAYSDDAGVHWSLTELNSLASSRSEVLLLRLPGTAHLLCIWNQASADEIRSGFYRSRLSSAISKNSGRTWGHFRTLVASAGIKSAARIEPGPAKWLVSSGAVPRAPELIPPQGFRSVRAPRASVDGDTVFLVFDDRLYGRDASSPRGWKHLYMRHRLRAVPVAWFYGKDG